MTKSALDEWVCAEHAEAVVDALIARGSIVVDRNRECVRISERRWREAADRLVAALRHEEEA
ncbi:MAG TPA: hypothetical protein VGC04_04025 [Cellulomonas sp.]